MGYDENRRKLERRLAADPDDQDAAAQLARMETRVGQGRLANLREFVGRWCYVEGARMNYVGVLEQVTGTHAGEPAELVWSRLYRIGDWNTEGPRDDYTMELTTEPGLSQWLPWAACDNFGLAPTQWASWINAKAS